jgi:hypothetical protein
MLAIVAVAWAAGSRCGGDDCGWLFGIAETERECAGFVTNGSDPYPCAAAAATVALG